MSCAELPGIDLVTAFGLFAVELVKLPALIIEGEVDMPDLPGLYDIVLAMDLGLPEVEIPALGISAEVNLDLDIDPTIAAEISMKMALAFGEVFVALFLDMPMAILEAMISFDIPTNIPEFIAEFLIPVMNPDAALTLAGCIAEVLPI